MVTSQYTSRFAKSLNGTFYWFKKVISQKTIDRAKEFLMFDLNMKIVGISEKDNIFFAGEEYFVTRIKVNKENNVFFRISSNLMDMILTKILGEASENFQTDNLTELEAKILTGLNDFIFKGISPFLAKETKEESDELINTNLVHITFLAQNKEGLTGKYIISIPINLLPEIRAFATKQHFDMGAFPKYKVPVKLITGKSEITLYDVQHIESGDIVVLEQSNIKKMVIDIYGERKEFLLNPETSIITGIDNDGDTSMENNTNQNAGTMWDVIPVEISAEFEKVTITLGELKQISEGAVVDVGAIYENKIFLKVENKPIASGELIIINDKYAVRVDEVYTDGAAPAPAPKQSAKQPAKAGVTPPKQGAAKGANDDFNYANFDIEDENI
ncbi:FliM/FliN family flagellar motor switch protein [bacterium]|nr:FliM/FliN family flagellar motor switch protein [bacterium]